MPLIVIVGSGFTGKTTRALELKDYFIKMGKKVEIISDSDDVNLAYKGKSVKKIYFLDSFNEKETRGKLKAGIQRLLDKNTILIADSTNYIKGYRYELFRITRTVDTTNVIVRKKNFQSRFIVIHL